MSTNTNETTEHLKHYLEGMNRAAPSGETLDNIAAIDDWAERAKEEMRRRLAAQTFGCLPDHIVAAIASGSVSLSDVANQIRN